MEQGMATQKAPQEMYSKVEDLPGGIHKSPKNLMAEMGSSVLQNFAPVKQIDMHMCGFAFYADDPTRQVELHHFCSRLNDDFIQCAVYDNDSKNARLIGIEYVITEKIYKTLPPEEQKYWHNHAYDIKSGSFITIGLPEPLDKTIRKDMIPTYGKTFLLWQVDRGDTLPLGEPKLMMVANKEGEWNPKLFEYRDKKYNYDSRKTSLLSQDTE